MFCRGCVGKGAVSRHPRKDLLERSLTCKAWPQGEGQESEVMFLSGIQRYKSQVVKIKHTFKYKTQQFYVFNKQ